MFLARYTINNKSYNYVYIKKYGGFEAFQKDTSYPDTKNIDVLDFSIRGKTYKERKTNAEDLAIYYSNNFACLPWSYGELATICEQFQKIGKRYGLIKEFKENCIF